MNRYKRLIYHFPTSERLAPEDCDDVFQETLTALYRQLDKITQVDDLPYWISKVAQRQTWRAVNRRLKYSELTETYDVEDPDAIPEQELELKVQQSKVRQGLAQLNDKCRILLTRLFMDVGDSDYKKISEELGIAMGSIGPTRNRCLVKFKKILWKLGITEKNVSKWLD